jgi:hypothetical protein
MKPSAIGLVGCNSRPAVLQILFLGCPPPRHANEMSDYDSTYRLILTLALLIAVLGVVVIYCEGDRHR